MQATALCSCWLLSCLQQQSADSCTLCWQGGFFVPTTAASSSRPVFYVPPGVKAAAPAWGQAAVPQPAKEAEQPAAEATQPAAEAAQPSAAQEPYRDQNGAQVVQGCRSQQMTRVAQANIFDC